MLDGHQIRDARLRAGLTQEQLAEKLGVTLRTVGNWERGATIPRAAMPKLRDLLGVASPADRVISLVGATDAQLLAEIARRFDRGSQGVMGNAQHPAPIVPMPPRGEIIEDVAAYDPGDDGDVSPRG